MKRYNVLFYDKANDEWIVYYSDDDIVKAREAWYRCNELYDRVEWKVCEANYEI